MSDEALLRRLLREHAEAVSTETAIIKEDAIVRLFYVVQDEAAEAAEARLAERDAEVARLTELQRAASEFIGYIKAGNNAKAHLQMLFLEVLINEESKNGAKK